MIIYRVNLSSVERAALIKKVNKGKGKARDIQKAHVLLASDETVERQSEAVISHAYCLSVKSVERIRRQFCERGMGIFEPQPRKIRSDKKIDGAVEAHLIAISCSQPPEGQSRWKLKTIADKAVELGVIEHIGATSVGIVLKKNEIKPWRVKQWVIPPKQSAAFVHQMEQVLSVYERPYNEMNPVVCLDESPRQLIEVKEERKEDATLLQDSEYIRKGVAEMYMAFEPLAGSRWVSIEEDHAAKTWVKVVSSLLDNHYKHCAKITLVEDNLTAHRPCTFYEVYEPQRAKAYLDRIEFVFTPKHGSWPDMAEIELSVLERDCQGSFESKEKLEQHIAAWQKRRNEKEVKANWQFTNKDARIKLAKLYPTT